VLNRQLVSGFVVAVCNGDMDISHRTIFFRHFPPLDISLWLGLGLGSVIRV